MVTSRPNPAFDRAFPAAAADGYDERSGRDYNCVAWAGDRNAAVWWPFPDAHDIGAYWPPGVERAETVPAFVAALATVGYADRGLDGSLVDAMERLAISATSADGVTVPQHVAWQMPDGAWSSRIVVRGRDVVHSTPDALASGPGGPTPYGTVVQYMSRPRRPRQCDVPVSGVTVG